MMRSVLPRITARERWLLTGQTDESPSSGGRLPPLEDEEEGLAGNDGDHEVAETLESDMDE
jgi:hypothetical protein